MLKTSPTARPSPSSGATSPSSFAPTSFSRRSTTSGGGPSVSTYGQFAFLRGRAWPSSPSSCRRSPGQDPETRSVPRQDTTSWRADGFEATTPSSTTTRGFGFSGSGRSTRGGTASGLPPLSGPDSSSAGTSLSLRSSCRSSSRTTASGKLDSEYPRYSKSAQGEDAAGWQRTLLAARRLRRHGGFHR